MTITQNPHAVTTAKFCLDGPAYPGLHNPLYRWNGWVQPSFTKSILKRIANDLGNVEFKFIGDSQAFLKDLEDDEWTEMPMIEHEGIKYFCTDSWCWTLETDDDA